MLDIKELKKEVLQLLEHGEVSQKRGPGLAGAFARLVRLFPDSMTDEEGPEIKNTLEVFLSILKDLNSETGMKILDFVYRFPPEERDGVWRLMDIELKKRMQAAAEQ